ncbi:MAG: hypothetical protein L6406_06160, partial [Desulfobacterales bacterium]|nr:hypothetical protein [Desulfobacterales bacterium]
SEEATRKTETQAEIKEREAYIKVLLADYDKAHEEMAKELREKLSSEEATRKTETQAEIKEREAYIKVLLADYDKAHQEMAKELREKLINEENERKAADQAEIRERKWAISSMLEEFKKEQAETAAAWKKLLATMRAAREPAVIKPAEVEPEVEEAQEELAEDEGLKKKILDLLDNDPDGLKMVEMGDMLGIENWRSLIPVMRDLLDEGEVTKENTTYYLA